MDSLRQGKIKIINWHALAWQSEEKIAKKKSVDKRGAKSDEAYVKEFRLGYSISSKKFEKHHVRAARTF